MKTFDFDSSVLSDNTENPQKRIASHKEIRLLAETAAQNPYSLDYMWFFGFICECESNLDGYPIIREEVKSAYLEAIKHVPDPLSKILNVPFQTHINYVKDMCVLTGLEESEILDILPKSSSTIKFLSDVSEISGFSIQDVFDVLPSVTFLQDDGTTAKVTDVNIHTLHIYAPAIAEKITRMAAQKVTIKRRRNKKVPIFLDKAVKSYFTKSENESYPVPVERKGSKKKINIYCSIAFDALLDPSSRYLNPYDKLVYSAICSLYEDGITCFSATQIFELMGNRGNPTADYIEKILLSVKKLMGIVVDYDNTEESEKYRYDYIKIKSKNLLYAEINTAVINGGITENAIYLKDIPLLLGICKKRKQLTSVSVEYFQKVTNTKNAIAFKFYILQRMVTYNNKQNNAKRNIDNYRKILYQSIFDDASFVPQRSRDTDRQKQLIKKILDHFKDCQRNNPLFIDYRMTEDGIILQFTQDDVEKDLEKYGDQTYEERTLCLSAT